MLHLRLSKKSIIKGTKNNPVLILGIVIIILVDFFIYLAYLQNYEVKTKLIDTELQRKAVITAFSFQSALQESDGVIIRADDGSKLSQKLEGLIENVEEIRSAEIALQQDNYFLVISASSPQQLGTTLTDKDYFTAIAQNRVVSFKELKVYNEGAGEYKNRFATVIAPIELISQDEPLGEKGILIIEMSLNDIDYLTDIFTTNSRLLSIFQAIVVSVILIIGASITNTSLKRNRELTTEVITKDQLLASAAHELGNPVGFIRGALSRIIKSEDKISKKGHVLLRRTMTTANFLSTFIEDLLIVSRLERGKIKIYPRPMHLLDTIEFVYESNLINAEQKGIKMILKKPKEKLPKIIADPDKIREVVTNLVSNAIKYSYKGCITITLEQIENDYLKVSVQDEGEGITKNDMGKLFQRFVRLTSTAQREKGTGLGLYISKILVEMHKGKIGATSVLGKGSTFYFTIPINLYKDD